MLHNMMGKLVCAVPSESKSRHRNIWLVINKYL